MPRQRKSAIITKAQLLPLYDFKVVIQFRDGSQIQTVRQGTGSYALMKELEPKIRAWKRYNQVAGWTVHRLDSDFPEKGKC